MSIAVQLPEMNIRKVIPTPDDIESVIDLFMQWQLSQDEMLNDAMTREQVVSWLSRFIKTNAGGGSADKSSGINVGVAPGLAPGMVDESQPEEYSRDYENDHFDELRLK
ncbi:MAG TPA: hypothetical protein VFV68_07325 [Agriterribacter sp.]|nr:hypothetical protein [Agriterribacter sp.]